MIHIVTNTALFGDRTCYGFLDTESHCTTGAAASSIKELYTMYTIADAQYPIGFVFNITDSIFSSSEVIPYEELLKSYPELFI